MGYHRSGAKSIISQQMQPFPCKITNILRRLAMDQTKYAALVVGIRPVHHPVVVCRRAICKTFWFRPLIAESSTIPFSCFSLLPVDIIQKLPGAFPSLRHLSIHDKIDWSGGPLSPLDQR